MLLDIHVLIWAFNKDRRLGPTSRKIVEQGVAVVSVISLWEVVIKRSVGKLGTSIQDVIDLTQRNGMQTIGIETQDCFAVEGLPLLHRDPFDRMLVAQAMRRGWALMSADSRVRGYSVASLDPRD